MPKHDETERVAKEIQMLEKRLEDLKARLPAHSIPPAMMIELDEIEEELQIAIERLAKLQNKH